MKYEWKYGQNDYQKYYDVIINGDYLCVFANKWEPDIWLAMVKGRTLHDKTANNKQRKKQGLQNGCHYSKLLTDVMLCNKKPEYMMKKAEWCYEHDIEEVSR